MDRDYGNSESERWMEATVRTDTTVLGSGTDIHRLDDTLQFVLRKIVSDQKIFNKGSLKKVLSVNLIRRPNGTL